MKHYLFCLFLSAISFGAYAMDLRESADIGAKNITDADRRDLIEAASAGDITKVAEYLSKGKSILIKPEGWGGSALFVASAKGHVEVVRALVAHGAEINETVPAEPADAFCYQGYTPLQIAADKGHHEIVTLLIDGGADIFKNRIYESTNISTIQLAVWAGHHKVVEVLLAHLKKNSIAITCKGLIHYAVRQENKDMIKALLDHDNTRVNEIIADFGNRTPLHEAAEKGNLEIIQELLSRGASIFHFDSHDQTPFRIACLKGHDKAAKTLIESVETNRRAALIYGTKDFSLLHDVAARGYIGILAILVEYVEADLLNKQGLTPLIYASANGHTNAAQLLIGKGANVNACSKGNALNYLHDHTVLMAAAAAGHDNTVEFLVNCKDVDILKTNSAQNTALEIAVLRGEAASLVILLAKLVDSVNLYSSSLYHIALCINEIETKKARLDKETRNILLRILLKTKATIETKQLELSKTMANLKKLDPAKLRVLGFSSIDELTKS